MDANTLTEVIDARLQDFAERRDYLVTVGDLRSAELIQKEWNQLLYSFHDNEPFLVLSVPEGHSA